VIPAFRQAVRWAEVSGFPPTRRVSEYGLFQRLRNTGPVSGRFRSFQIVIKDMRTTGRIAIRRDRFVFVRAPSALPVCSMSRTLRSQSTQRQPRRRASCVRMPVSHNTSMTGAAHGL
jgi:hypothetical protein